MKLFALLIALNITSFACVVGATFLAANGKEGWGWLMLLALATHCWVSGKAHLD